MNNIEEVEGWLISLLFSNQNEASIYPDKQMYWDEQTALRD